MTTRNYTTDPPVLSWTTCACCGGALPMLDGDNDHPGLDAYCHDGDCPRMRTPNGYCGAYRDAGIDEIIEAYTESDDCRDEDSDPHTDTFPDNDDY
jgi:hypothetical protein